jgi:iron complex outermembrane receptor protein
VGGTIRYITNQPKIGVVEGSAEAGVNFLKDGSMGYDTKGAFNVPFADTAALRIVGYNTHFGGFIDSVGPFHKQDVNDGNRFGTRVSILWQPAPQIRITPRYVYQRATAGGFNREEHYNLYDNQFTSGTAGTDLGERTQYLKKREHFRDKTQVLDLTASYDFGPAELTSASSKVIRNVLVSRDASALTGSVGISPFALALGVDPAIANLTSNLRDTTKLNQFTQELRIASTGAGPLSWVFGGFYSNVKRDYFQRLPTPGYDAFIDARFGPGFSATQDNGFGLVDNPYHANLPYKIKQKALFGEGSYRFSEFKLTAGGRWYDFKETRDFRNGGIFSPLFTSIGDKTKSNGFNPRVIATWEPNRSLSVNLQAAKGFRLGGINDPLNIPLCSAEDAAIYGPFATATYGDETLWNYEAGVKYSRAGITFNAAGFHTSIRDLQVTVDAGGCSSRLVFNVPKAHTTGAEAEFAVHPLQGLELSFAGSYVDSKFDSTIANPILATRTGIREGNRLPTVPKYQFAGTANYEQPFSASARWYVNGSVQRVGNRYTQPGDQEPGAGSFTEAGGNPAIFFDPVTGAFGTGDVIFDSVRLPAYTLVNASVGMRWDSGFEISAYVNNLFDANPKLSLDRERGGRARLGFNIGQPRMIGLVVRQTFGSRVGALSAPVPLPPPPPATQTCPDGSVIAVGSTCPVPPAPPPPPPPPAPERG